MKDQKRKRTFEGQKEKNCHQDQQHTEGEREDGNIDLKGERGQRVLHLQQREREVIYFLSLILSPKMEEVILSTT